MYNIFIDFICTDGDQNYDTEHQLFLMITLKEFTIFKILILFIISI